MTQQEKFDAWFNLRFSQHASANVKAFVFGIWQAGIESVVVELPKGEGDECGHLVPLADVEDALDAAGVSYK